MLDDLSVIAQRDPSGCLEAAVAIGAQMRTQPHITEGEINYSTPIHHVVLAGMGGSALAAELVQVLTSGWLHVPLIVTKKYELPGFINQHTLVITISHSGNTEETLACYDQAQKKQCRAAAISKGGKLLERAAGDHIPHIRITADVQPRMAVISHLRAILALLAHFSVIDKYLYNEIESQASWLEGETQKWAAHVATAENPAKQLARFIIGKTPVFFAGELTWPLAYKWKISWNESAKNVAFWNQYPEFNHNEFIGWSGHPIEKPFAIIDLVSDIERPRIRERMELSDRLLSGMRPKAHQVYLRGESLLQQLLWGLMFGEIVSIYGAILNGVNPAPVPLVEKLKKELS